MEPRRGRDYQTIEALISGSGKTGNLTSDPIESGGYAIGVATIDIDGFTRTDADEELDVYIQTSFDEGGHWTDLINYHTETAGAQVRILPFGIPNTVPGAVTPTDGALANDTDVDLPIGDVVRVKVVHTDPGGSADTYDINVSIHLKA